MITLISDFGLDDPYVGIMKSRIAQRAPQIPIIDLTHRIAPFAAEQAGYWLWCCLGQFPAGTVHLAVVDPGVGAERDIVVLEAAAQLFIAPNNGLLGLVGGEPEARAYALSQQARSRLGLESASATFHGRDIMAPLAAELACTRIRAVELGPRVALRPGRLTRASTQADGSVRGVVAVIDRYGNALTTISVGAIAHLRQPQVQLQERYLPWVRTYSQADVGECVALINSSGMLELAAREASAAQALDVRVGQTVYVHDR